MYSANTRALKKIWPGFSHEIESEYSPDNAVEFFTAASGSAGMKYNGRHLTSPRDPAKEAERLIASAFPNPVDIAVFLHFGLGYEIEALKRRWPDTQIIVLEPRVPLFLSALHARNFLQLLSPPGITMIMDTEPSVLGQLLNDRHHESVCFFPLRNIARLNPEYLEEAAEWFRRFNSRREINTNTLKRFGKVWVRNLFANLPVMAKAGSVEDLKDIFRGFPVLVLAAGPSLDNLSPFIKNLTERMVIIAVDTASGWCRIHGITPDFLVVVDPQYWNTRHLDFTQSPGIIISESSTHPGVFRKIASVTLFCASLFPLGRFFESYCGVGGILGAGGSVSTTAWDLARFLGAGRIFIAGLDLGYPDLKTHYKGSLFEELSHVWSDRTKPSETSHFKTIRDGSPLKTAANNGKDVLSDRRLSLYRWWFENRMKEPQTPRTYNLSDGGVRIEGMTPELPQRLTELPAIRRELKKLLEPFTRFSAETPAAGSHIAAQKLLQGLSDLENSLNRLRSDCEDALSLLNDSTVPLDVRFSKLRHLDAKILSSPVKDIAGFLITPPESKSATDAETESRNLYTGIISSIEYHSQQIRVSVDSLHKY